MKKQISIIMLVLIVISLVGCSSNQEAGGELESEKTDNLSDIKDRDSLYAFIEQSYPGIYSRDDFDLWESEYIDITRDGTDEVAFSAPYGEGNLDEFIIISCDNEQFEIIPSNIGFAKYENKIEMDGDFIIITQKTGGSGIHLTTMGIYRYDGMEIIFTDTELVIEDVFSSPDGYEAIGEIKGNLTDFVYTMTKTDIATEKTSILEKARYIYDIENMRFDVEEMSTPESTQVKLNLSMTKKDLINTLGDQYTLEHSFNGMNDANITIFKYDGIEFHFEHYTEEAAENSLPSYIEINSNKYKYNYDINIGDKSLNAIEECEETFEHAINMHGEEDERIPDYFFYEEYDEFGQLTEDGYILGLKHNTGERYFDIDDITEDVIVEAIMFFSSMN